MKIEGREEADEKRKGDDEGRGSGGKGTEVVAKCLVRVSKVKVMT